MTQWAAAFLAARCRPALSLKNVTNVIARERFAMHAIALDGRKSLSSRFHIAVFDRTPTHWSKTVPIAARCGTVGFVRRLRRGSAEPTRLAQASSADVSRSCVDFASA